MSDLSAREFRRILLIKPSAVGDVIHTLPVLARLRRRYPDARIDWLLTPAIAELVGRHPALSNVLLFPRSDFTRLRRLPSAVVRLGRLVAAIRKARYDLVIDLHGQFRSAAFTLASGAPVRVGFDRPGSVADGSAGRLAPEVYRHAWTGAREGAWVAYTHRIPIPTLDVHAIDRYLWVSPMLGLPEGPPDFHLPVVPQSEERVDGLLRAEGLDGAPLALVIPGTTWETKRWTVDGFAEVARHLCRTGRGVALAGSASERPLARAVIERCPGARDLCGRTSLSEMAALTRRAEVCVTNDSGTMHLAVALDRPVVSVFGPTEPIWVGPYGRPDAVVRAGLDCSPCYLRRLRHCPHGHACMTGVSAASVIDRLEAMLAVSAAGGARGGGSSTP